MSDWDQIIKDLEQFQADLRDGKVFGKNAEVEQKESENWLAAMPESYIKYAKVVNGIRDNRKRR